MKLDIEGLTVEYGQVAAVHGLNLTVGHGELVALVGPSGCGKTTTLGFITGFIRGEGRPGPVRRGRRHRAWSPQRRGIGYVFQDYAIYPHMTVRENIRFPLDAAKMDRKQAERDVDEIAGLMGVGGSWPGGRTSSRAASGSASPWLGRSSRSRSSCCSTSRCRTSMPTSASRSGRRSGGSSWTSR